MLKETNSLIIMSYLALCFLCKIVAMATRGMSQNRAPYTTTHSPTTSSGQLDVTQPSHDSEIHETQQISIENQPSRVEGTVFILVSKCAFL